jgi:2-amino-4-hydroxy-6-hydroxymethyldihydropteridine diphosphokinase
MSPLSHEEAPNAPVTVLLGLGASLGDRLLNLQAALERLQEKGIQIRAVSPIYESPHLGLHAGDSNRYPPHLNLVAEIETVLSPEALLDTVQAVEEAGGRERIERWGPRTIDIDILDYGGQEIKTDRLILPHPGIADRAFVARPLLDIVPDYRLKDETSLRDRMAHPPLSSQQIARIGFENKR